jgi:hypothetical protein
MNMNKLLAMSLFLAVVAPTTVYADYKLVCDNELSMQDEVVNVKEETKFEAACRRIKNDPAYGEYGNCKDGEGNKKGKCPG